MRMTRPPRHRAHAPPPPPGGLTRLSRSQNQDRRREQAVRAVPLRAHKYLAMASTLPTTS